MLGSTTSRRKFSTASRSASLMPNVATSHSSPVACRPLCGMAARSAKPILGIAPGRKGSGGVVEDDAERVAVAGAHAC